MSPAAIKNNVGVFTGNDKDSIVKVEGSIDGLAENSLNDSSPARGTPIKLTRSLPANAIARENVPTRTIILSILTLNIEIKN